MCSFGVDVGAVEPPSSLCFAVSSTVCNREIVELRFIGFRWWLVPRLMHVGIRDSVGDKCTLALLLAVLSYVIACLLA